MTTTYGDAINDVWLRFDAPDDDQAAYEANIRSSIGGGYRVEWYHTSVGLISSQCFVTLDKARAWLMTAGYEDYSS